MCLFELLCCCCGPSACGLCCKGTKSSITTRILYVVFLAFLVILCGIMLAPQVQQGLANFVLCTGLNVTTPEINIGPVSNVIPTTTIIRIGALPCSQFVGYLAVYRICMAVASFFFILMLLMLCVFSSKDPRAYIQNGFWFFKWLVVIALIVGFFFIPSSDNFAFSKACVVLGMLGGILFIIFQVVFFVDFAHVWAETILAKKEETENNCWYTLLVVPSIIFYIVALAGVILMFVFFSVGDNGPCSLNIIFLVSIVVLSIGVSIVAILPWVQEAQPSSGLLQPSIVALYTTYLTWSAVSNEPYGPKENCVLNPNNTVGAFFTGNAVASSVIGILLMFFTVAYTTIYLSSNKQLQKFRGNHKDDDEGYYAVCCDCCCPSATEAAEKEEDEGDTDEDGKKRMHVHDDEKERVTYNYSFFHFLMMIAVLYIMIQLTNWTDPGEAQSSHFQNTIASTWVKMASAWLCFAVYLWTLIAPLILRNRDFGYADSS